MAVSWIESSSDDELAVYLPQLVQVSPLHAINQIPLLVLISCSWSEVAIFEIVLSVQALKFECHLKNALVMFLLSRALGNVNIAHYLYW